MGEYLIVGVGGLGCAASVALAQAGARALTLYDGDVVDVSNLHRQLLFTEADVGVPKALVAAQHLKRRFPSLSVTACTENVTAANAVEVLAAHTVTLDGTDSPEAKFMLSDAAAKSGAHLVYGAAVGWEGRAMPIAPEGPCLRCLFEGPPPDAQNCTEGGILGPVAAFIGSLQAALALRPRPWREAKLSILDGRAFRLREITVPRRASCGIHSS